MGQGYPLAYPKLSHAAHSVLPGQGTQKCPFKNNVIREFWLTSLSYLLVFLLGQMLGHTTVQSEPIFDSSHAQGSSNCGSDGEALQSSYYKYSV